MLYMPCSAKKKRTCDKKVGVPNPQVCNRLNLVTLLGQGGGGMLSVNGRSSGYRGTRGDRGSVRDRSGWSRAKSCDDICKSCDEVYPRVDRERSPAMMIAQGWIASKVLRWWLQVLRWGLPKGGSRAKSCNDDCPRVGRKRSSAMMIAQGWIAGWLRDNCATLLNHDRSATGTMAVQGTAKGELRRGKGVDDNRWE